jgi:hypothetical protein
MPTILRVGAYRFYFYSHEPNEPPHVHIDRDDSTAKFWLNEVRLANNIGFKAKELKDLEEIVKNNQNNLMAAWNEYFSD